MISLPPNERDLHAYVDHQLSEVDRRQLEIWLAAHPEVAAQVHAWQQDAQHLRAALGAAPAANPQLDPALIRQRLKHQSRRQLATAAMLVLAVSLGGLGGWQARQATLVATALPMTDAMQAYRLFAQERIMPADYQVQGSGDMQAWLDRYFTQAHRLPDLSQAGFNPVSGRLLTTDQGAAAMVLYENPQGRRISFYIRPPGPQNTLLPPGSRNADGLQAQYWSSPGYNYAMVSQEDEPTTPLLKQTTRF
ncbi:regulator [Pseudomonas brenneri]|uniref:Anti-sigma factor n=1 Tax=Pseudomonas brenneri TaxID=129817 RepID=A0A5B2UZF8_9PSED|nr:anti-sigma factor [Pseudomonas brenneri]KAA6173731.1 anti-sigma factor [Pseudomonas marginalis]KAA2231862.1 anti-sigma factor [Pseudomonas brenneri]TWR79487.1 anti-sigma factor [Pseudomonas brenneri]SDU88420.1 Transmembrane transcriptional regulator (anti-sigma factor RsiW) [Pseudomonas brenneri]GGL39620.1 regulator [Pseudomonas brenneri]